MSGLCSKVKTQIVWLVFEARRRAIRCVFERRRRGMQTEVLDGSVDARELALILSNLARFNGAMLGRWLVVRWLSRTF
jgi:hypothetical protein